MTVVVVVMLAKMMSVVVLLHTTMTTRCASRWRRADLQHFSHGLGRDVYIGSTFLPTILSTWMKGGCAVRFDCSFRFINDPVVPNDMYLSRWYFAKRPPPVPAHHITPTEITKNTKPTAVQYVILR